MRRDKVEQILRNLSGPIVSVAVLLAYVVFAQIDPPPSQVLSQTRSRVHLALQKADGPEIIYFGSSTTRENDVRSSDKRSVADFFAEHLGIPKKKVLLVSRQGGQPRLFEATFNSLVDRPELRGHLPRMLIVPIDMRAFSVTWAGNPRLQYAELVAALENHDTSYVDDMLHAAHLDPRPEVARLFRLGPHRVRTLAGPPIPVYGRKRITYQKYRLILTGLFTENGAPLAAIEPGTPRWHHKLETQFRAHYLNDISDRHPYLQALIRLGEKARAHGVKVVYYVAPVNIEDLRRYTGEDAQRLEKNIHFVIDTLEHSGAKHVLDLSHLLPQSEFTDKQWSCDHLTPSGRSARAKGVADYVRSHGLLDKDR